MLPPARDYLPPPEAGLVLAGLRVTLIPVEKRGPDALAGVVVVGRCS
jgi:hypothetical protein